MVAFGCHQKGRRERSAQENGRTQCLTAVLPLCHFAAYIENRVEERGGAGALFLESVFFCFFLVLFFICLSWVFSRCFFTAGVRIDIGGSIPRVKWIGGEVVA